MSNKLLQNNHRLTALELAAVLTKQNWAALEKFAEKRLQRSAANGHRQRALILTSGRVLAHTVIEQMVRSDLGFRGGRTLSPQGRSGIEPFLDALRGAINSSVANLAKREEFALEHVPVGAEEIEDDIYEPRDQASLPDQLEFRDLERHLFSRLEQDAANHPGRQAALAALRADCLTGNICGENSAEIDPEQKRHVRRLARRTWQELSMD